MAMIHQPRQIAEGPNAGKWHMTRASDEGGPVFRDCPEDCPGHDTAEQAAAHPRQVEIAKAEVFDAGDQATEQRRCAICSAWTSGFAMTGGPFPEDRPLCKDHRSHEHIAAAFAKR